SASAPRGLTRVLAALRGVRGAGAAHSIPNSDVSRATTLSLTSAGATLDLCQASILRRAQEAEIRPTGRMLSNSSSQKSTSRPVSTKLRYYVACANKLSLVSAGRRVCFLFGRGLFRGQGVA